MAHVKHGELIFLGFVKACGDVVLRALFGDEQFVQFQQDFAGDKKLVWQKTLQRAGIGEMFVE